MSPFRIACALLALAGLGLALLIVPEPGTAALAKLGEGGMWTALAVFLLAALVLGLRGRAPP